MLNVENIEAGYGDHTVLRGVSFNLQPGELLAIIGPNGSGKSTLIRALSGVLPLLAGSIRVDGRNISQIHDQDRARLIAVVPQARNLPSAFTAREVVALGRTPHLNWLGQLSQSDEVIIDEAMRQTNTAAFANSLANELSGGEQQRLLLARALVQQTPVLLMDEPTTHLDLQFQFGLMQHIHSLAHPPSAKQSARAVLIGLHDLNLAYAYADKVAMLVCGKITHFGSPEEVLQPGILSEIYNVPMVQLKDPNNGKVAFLPK